MRLLSQVFVLAAGVTYGQSDWSAFAHDPGAQRYSPLSQITPKNISKLKLAWQYGIDPAAATAPAPTVGAASEATPLMIDGIVYMPTSKRTVVALDPESGKEIWKYETGRAAAPTRGVSYWPGDKQTPARILFGTSDGRLVAVNAKTGKPVPGFGDEGAVNLKIGVTDKFPNMNYHMSSPGSVYRDLIITGAQGQEDNMRGPYQDVRAWDVRTGKLLWTFHVVPHPGEVGYETNPADLWETAGSPGVWGAMSMDAQRGIVFIPLGQPAPQYFGGARPGQNLFASSVVALDANTGKLKWYFQLTHHDIWDYDASVAPALVDITQNGKKIPAVVAINKASLMFFLNRETGQPIYKVEERPVAQSDTPGEQTWPTQPFPVKPPPLARVSIKPEDIFKGEAKHEKFCHDLVEQIGGIHNEGPYTPYSTKEYRLIFPSQVGGVNFGGLSVDPKLGYVFVNSLDLAGMGKLERQGEGDAAAWRRISPLGRSSFFARFWDPDTRQPCQMPPWSHLTAVNANTGDIAWSVPLGTSDEMESKGVHNTGAFGLGGSIVTAGGVVFVGATNDRRFHAFESKTGKLLWEGKLDIDGTSTPMTYMGKNGKQYVLIVSSGVNAFALE